jgi:hypothetical protein
LDSHPVNGELKVLVHVILGRKPGPRTELEINQLPAAPLFVMHQVYRSSQRYLGTRDLHLEALFDEQWHQTLSLLAKEEGKSASLAPAPRHPIAELDRIHSAPSFTLFQLLIEASREDIQEIALGRQIAKGLLVPHAMLDGCMSSGPKSFVIVRLRWSLVEIEPELPHAAVSKVQVGLANALRERSDHTFSNGSTRIARILSPFDFATFIS